jgi:hypothetical protein
MPGDHHTVCGGDTANNHRLLGSSGYAQEKYESNESESFHLRKFSETALRLEVPKPLIPARPKPVAQTMYGNGNMRSDRKRRSHD